MMRRAIAVGSVLLVVQGIAGAAPTPPKLTSMEPTSGPAGTPIRLEGEGLKRVERVVFAVGETITTARFRVLPDGALDVVAPEYYRQGAAATVAVFTKDAVTVAMPSGGRVVERVVPGGGGREPGLSFYHVLQGGTVRQLSSPGVIEKGGAVGRASGIGMVFVKAGGLLERFDDNSGVVFHEPGALFGPAITNRHPQSATGPLIEVGEVTVSDGVGPFVYQAADRPPEPGEAPRPQPAGLGGPDAEALAPPEIKSVTPWEGIMGQVITLKGRGFATARDVYFHDRILSVRAVGFHVVSDQELRVQVPDQRCSMGGQFIIVVTNGGATVTIPRDNIVRGAEPLDGPGRRRLFFVDWPVRWAGVGEVVNDRNVPMIYIDDGGIVQDCASQVIFVKRGGKLDVATAAPALLIYERGALIPKRLTQGAQHGREVKAIKPSFLDTSFRVDYGQLLTRFRSPQPASEPRRGPAAPKPGADANENKKPIDPAMRAASRLAAAHNLEKSGKLNAAMEYYRDIVKTYPNTTEAKTAAERIRVLEAK
ncbi:MAG: IPT/TIG domain-containing protein [Isosphaeraceae bacterium]|nr:IPT/TIG domain-containing protein [Isosphaeraceae bacterium]